MSVFWQGGRLGLAYYDVESTQIYMMMDCTEHDDFSLLQRGNPLLYAPLTLLGTVTAVEYKF